MENKTTSSPEQGMERPIDHYEGLSARGMQLLVYEPFGADSPLSIRDHISDAALNAIPLFRIGEELLKIMIRENGLKPTPKGSFQIKILEELARLQLIPVAIYNLGYYVRPSEEEERIIYHARDILREAGLIKKSLNKLIVTPKGEKLADPGKRQAFFKTFLTACIQKYDWAKDEAFGDTPVAQLGMGYTLYLLCRYGKHPFEADEYADKYLKAFPSLTTKVNAKYYPDPADALKDCYKWRTFGRLLLWFGMIRVEGKLSFQSKDKAMIHLTDIFTQVFEFTSC